MYIRYFFRRGYLAFRNLHDFCLRFVCNRITPVFKGECSSYSFKFDNFYGSNGQTETHRSCRRFIPRKNLGRMEGGHRVTQQFLSKLKNSLLPFTKRFQMLWEWTSAKETLLSWTFGKKRKQPTNFFSRQQQNLVPGCFCWSHFRQAWTPAVPFFGVIFLESSNAWWFGISWPSLTRWAPKNQLQIPNGMKKLTPG